MARSDLSHRRVTAADIARSLGVSRATVGFVLNETAGQTISEQTKKRVLDEARRLGYRPHTAARALASGRSRIVLAVLPDWPLDFSLRRHLEEASLVLDEAGYSFITYTAHPTGQARPLWETLAPDVVLSVTGRFTSEQIASLRAAGIPAIVPNPDDLGAEEYPEEGPLLQMTHLESLGHRRVAFAESADSRIADLVATRRARAEGAAKVLQLAPPLTLSVSLDPGSAESALDEMLRRGITAVAAYNDDVAVALVGAALRRRLDVPQDLSVVGHDDAPVAAILEPQLSTVRVDTAGLGRYIAALALSAAEGAAAPSMPPETRAELVARASTGPAPKR
ncbi:LacI family DNA-binding transcriptional regulator [Herbiconiux sp. SYSU D00978]|uniref:LacI family DNA-binding transcriptional regulator n=1 Tax=Herbiconiux sp. SYSU D00978 TaxID=2812562 RepID=UPI001A972829|nr:LacI family DNA-binding transcriptional regulator [Herbiconiux sp. SYSU D00978]